MLKQLSDLFVNASEITRFWSLQEGVGHGRIRISLLFRPVEAKLPPNLLGFDTGTIEIRDVAVQSQHDLSQCEVRLKTTTTPAEEKVSRKIAEKRDDGRVVWSHHEVEHIPVRQRYGTALLVSFRDSAGFKSSRRKALGVLWLRDLVDHAEGTVEIALWHAKHGDYSRLKLNYVPPDGNLEYWDSDKDKIERIGSVFLDLVFIPGISERHHKLLSGAGAKRRGAWDEYDREKAGGMREAVGTMDDEMPVEHHARESHETQLADGHDEGPPRMDKTMTGGPLNSVGGDSASVEGEDATEGTNTVVATKDVEEQQKDEVHLEGGAEGSGDEAAGESSDESSSTHGTKGPIGKFKEWRQHEKELHRDHRGIMQRKPARTAQWMKDNVEEGAHALKDRFKLHSRQPDVETEV